MSCILCFASVTKDERLSLFDYAEAEQNNQITASELIQTHLHFAEKVLTDAVINNPDTCLCNICWTNLETFHDFHQLIAANYHSDVFEAKEDIFSIQNNSDIIMYDEDKCGSDQAEEMIKDEIINDPQIIETEWLEETIAENEEPKKPKRVLSLQQSRASKASSSVTPDSADDQRIRETARMFCDICQDSLDSLRDAKSHYKNAHEVEGYIVCCERKFKQRCRLVEHVNTHYNYSYTCPICLKTFDSKSYVAKHLALHDENKQFECDYCPKMFSRKFQVRNHLLSVHIYDNVEPTFECLFKNCGKKFVNHARLKHHVDYTHSTNHVEICEICSKSFRTKNAIEEHMKTHARRAEDRIRCEICDHFLADVKSYNRHLKNHATEELDNTCSYCGKKSPNRNALKKHIKYVHEMPKSFQCRYCEKSFKRTRNLIDHEAAVHTLQDLYACTFCPKTFRNQSNMLAHRKKQHPDQYQKPKYMRDAI